MSKKSKSVLAKRIVILCLSLVFSSSTAFTVKFFINLADINDRNLRAMADLTMRYLNLDIELAIGPAINLTNSVASMVSEVESFDDLSRILNSMLPTVPAAFEMFYGTSLSRFEGGFFATATDWDPYGTNPQWDQVMRPWFIFAMKNQGRTVITDPYEDSSTGKTCVTIVRTVSTNGRVTGVVGVDVFLDVLTEIVTSRIITSDGNTFIINREGLYLVHQNQEYSMNRNFFQTEGRELEWNFSSDVEVSILGNRYWASMPKTGLDWIIVSSGTTEELNRDFWRILTTTILLALVIVVVVIIASLRFSYLLTSPIIGLFDILKTIAAGDFTQKIAGKGRDEISHMTELLNETQESIKNLIISIKNETDTLSGIGNDLAVNMNETASSISEITANVQTIKDRVMNQGTSVNQSHVTMEQLVLNINKLNSHVENQSHNISMASSAIEEMVANIQSVTGTLIKNSDNIKTLSEASEVGRSSLSEVAEDIQGIARESEDLLEINAVMENIASQTNLLSMNAAIEAAHAGEAGKGFAVVAEEIRKLAENSSEQSKTISTVLKKIKGSIDKITISTDNVLNRFEAIDNNIKIVAQLGENIRNAMEEQDIGSKQLLEGVGNVNEITRSVKSGSYEMLEGAREVIRESETLEKVTQEITSGINEMAAGSEHINDAINHVNDISRKNREAINGLKKEVSRFKVD